MSLCSARRSETPDDELPKPNQVGEPAGLSARSGVVECRRHREASLRNRIGQGDRFCDRKVLIDRRKDEFDRRSDMCRVK